MSKVIINPSVAVELEINPVYHSEVVPIVFTAEENWQLPISVKMWNSHQKNTELIAPALLIVDKVMTLTISPQLQSIDEGTYYFEVFTTNRVLFKGTIKVVK